MPTITDMQLSIVKLFGGIRQNIFIPNVSWGIGLRHECDLVIAHKTGYLTEIEIKRSSQDIKADLRKRHSHWEGPIRKVYFAVPEELADNPHIWKDAGIISIGLHTRYNRQDEKISVYEAKIIRRPKLNSSADKLTDKEYLHLLHLGCMRIWKLKEKIQKLQHQKD